MKTLRVPKDAAAKAFECWPAETVLAMNACLLAHPDIDVQRWFEEQVSEHLGCSPHGVRVQDSRIA